ncbi:uncharacterized protein HMPREF1541_10108 [Cyphellophora europaea CBS 101466]|uniref:beta-galactosidase n=1 Tax=Cyphellophora europaea (strain CBS 101466) TaxID=1220924 RepID=W2S921_CYPE1|nr:uncharacterized protein HMPREF1541_10108 [Cyphellophora europaea CBS 101466]ETN45231.1 hypothetical protein HMPREF1541_10108 [Cyphellophora europaea CBS 101466]
MSGTFPPSTPDWSNIEVIHKGTLAPRSYFFLYDDEAAALKADISASSSVNLSGTWKFQHSKSPFTAPHGFEEPNYDTSTWSDIQVPSHWQLQGWGAPHYTNFNYIIPVDPPHVPYDDNQTGSYVRKFVVPKDFVDQQIRLRFEGVDSAFHVYVNGREVGYSQGSRNASEFDITAFLDTPGENTLAVRVYQWSDGSYIEDQDQWRFSGIFRDVLLVAFPHTHIEDFHVQTLLDDEYKDADLQVKVTTQGTGPIDLKLLDITGQAVASDTKHAADVSTAFSMKLANPRKWSAEDPNLYKLVLSFGGRFIAQNVGFRRIEIVNGIYKVNGRRIVFRGANRHEHHPLHGRAVPYDFMKQDLLIMKKHNINAIRTCHQPSDPRLYSLADELGFWIMDEADLECHGFSVIDQQAMPEEDKIKSAADQQNLSYDRAARWTSDNPEWKDQYVDRAVQLVNRDKNHPCVIMWSLGNEAMYGRNHQAMYDKIKTLDTSRPVHYEGDREAKSADLFSQMYSSVDSIIDFAKEENFTKPLVLCEFIHAMGNGPGNIKEYVDAFYKYPRLQGGWVWEWANHGLLSKDRKTGAEFMAYGGDFGDEPNDYNFIMDGVLFSNHTPTPGLIEYTKAIEPVQVLSHADGKVTIINRYDTISLNHLKCEAQLVGDGVKKPLGSISIPSNIDPHTEAILSIPELDVHDLKGDIYLQLDFSLANLTLWAAAGHITSTSQLQLQAPFALSASLPVPTPDAAVPSIVQHASSLTITTASTIFTLSLASGHLTSLIKSGTEHIHASLGPHLTLSRALTDNDRPQDGQDWLRNYLHLARGHMRSISWSTDSTNRTTTVTVQARLAPPVLSWSFAATTTYTFHPSGRLHIHVTGKPQGANLPPTLPRIGLEMGLPLAFSRVDWFGRGPGESYKDKKLSQQFGNWGFDSVDDLWVDYEFPQEGGNRTDVRWVRFSAPSPTDAALSSVQHAAQGVVGQLANAMSNLFSPGAQTAPPASALGGSECTVDTTPSAPAPAPTAPSSSLTAHFGSRPNFSFHASRYSSADVDSAKHPHELHALKRDYVILRLDADHHGLGTGSCGPKTLDEYALKVEGGGWEFELVLE